jgi:putative transposase
VRYRHRRPDDRALREALRDTAGTHRRFGYRRLHVLLRRDGHVLNRKRTQRLYREEGLSVRRRRSRRRAIGTRAPLVTEARVNARWSLDPRHGPRTSGGTMARSRTSLPTAADFAF